MGLGFGELEDFGRINRWNWDSANGWILGGL